MADAAEQFLDPRFGSLLRKHRIDAALSQEALAERSGLSTRAISDLERGIKTRPYLDTVRRLADALELSVPDRGAFAAAATRPRQMVVDDDDALSPGRLPGAALPVSQTPLIGRDTELDQIGVLLGLPHVRLLTLTGPGGVGKTRLALALAERQRDEFTDGVCYVPLDAVRDPELVLPALAIALGLRDEGAAPLLERVQGLLKRKNLLLVIDNVEHILESVQRLADLLTATDAIKILATSRTRLHLSGEHEFVVAPLVVFTENANVPIEVAADFPAVQLFVARAIAVKPGFALTPENASAVAAICARLDGLPLAIELAAARIKFFAPSALLAMLEQRRPLLSGGASDTAERHQSVANAIAWSHDLLSADEQRMFRRLSVFNGGMTLEAAISVGNLDETMEPIAILLSLVDKSLVQCDESAAETRFWMLETVREFAFDHLRTSSEEFSVRTCHATCFAELAEAAERGMYGPDEVVWLDRCETELGNFRAALAWGLSDQGDVSQTMRIGSGLVWLWMTRAGMAEGRSWLENALVASIDRADHNRARALAVAGVLAFFNTDFGAAEILLKDAISVGESSNAVFETAWATSMLGGNFLFQGKIDEAHRYLLQGYELMEVTTNLPWKAFGRFWLGALFGVMGEFEKGLHYFHSALEIFRDLEFASGIASTLGNMGALVLKQGDVRRAKALIREALSIRFPLKDRWGVAQHLRELAQSAAEESDAERGVRLYAASIALLDSLQAAAPAAFVGVWRENEAWLASRPESPAYTSAWADGYNHPIDQAIREIELGAYEKVQGPSHSDGGGNSHSST